MWFEFVTTKGKSIMALWSGEHAKACGWWRAARRVRPSGGGWRHGRRSGPTPDSTSPVPPSPVCGPARSTCCRSRRWIIKGSLSLNLHDDLKRALHGAGLDLVYEPTQNLTGDSPFLLYRYRQWIIFSRFGYHVVNSEPYVLTHCPRIHIFLISILDVQ